MSAPSRRELITWAATVPTLALTRRAKPTIAIVGAGLAGLTCAYRLKRAGIDSTVYEASNRIGGRVRTEHNVMADGLSTEFGGEFIDTDHADARKLASELEIELDDVRNGPEARYQDYFYFGGRHRNPLQMAAALQPLVKRARADYRSAGSPFGTGPNAEQFDRMTVEEWIGSNEAENWILDLLRVSYTCDLGLDCGDQSALNLISMLGDPRSPGYSPIGRSDERFHVKGGNDRIPHALADRLPGSIRLDHRLEAILQRGRGITLMFNGRRDVKADIVVLCIPFTILRSVQIDMNLPPAKRLAIQSLGYGTNAKLLLGCRTRFWRDQQLNAEGTSDLPFQTTWDNSWRQPGTLGGLTVFTGGSVGRGLCTGSEAEQRYRLMPGLERALPGLTANHNGNVRRAHWPTEPLFLGSYACYRPGQWTTIAGHEGTRVENLYFAGEHCSRESQGFMNGAIETGRVAADRIVRMLS